MIRDSEYGVPPGFQLGPVSFHIYLNGMLKHLKVCEMFANVVGILVLVGHNNLKNAQERLQVEFSKMNIFSHVKRISYKQSKNFPDAYQKQKYEKKSGNYNYAIP